MSTYLRVKILIPTMKTLGGVKSENGVKDKEVSTPNSEPEKIDFSKVKIEPLFEEDVDFDTFSKSDFRAVKVKECVAVPKSKKLLQFTLDDGTGTDRTILSGLEGNGRPIDINLAAEAMKDILSPDDNKTVTPELIMDIVSDHFGVSIADLKSNKRPAEIAVPRQIVMYLCRKMTDVPLKSIGILLGGKNHSTIKHGVEKIEHDVEENEQLANTIDIIKKKINPV